ncbi:MAG: preprotein translocase subunit SecG [Rhizobiaceae bacterium]|jgi:preprotein translocase subunit SecG|nr:preprotein translocase subunit SecG [Rhizobiaceae bacterium]
METIIIVIHLMIVVALVGVVLLQRSEGGGLGIGGGSGFMTARGAANALTRSTAILAALFFTTSLILSVMARYGAQPTDILDRVPVTSGQGQGVLDAVGGAVGGGDGAPVQPAAPAVPTTEGSTLPAPATGAAPATDAAPAAQPGVPAQPAVPNN